MQIICKSFEFSFKMSLRKVLHSRAVLHRGTWGLPLQDLDELHLKKQKKIVETPSKNKTKFKRSDLKLNMIHTPKASLLTLP